MSKKAICVGINDYPGSYNDLNGCINDCDDWGSLLGNDFGFEVSQLKDNQATASLIKDSLTSMVNEANDGDVLVFTFSGHGTWTYDNHNPDESDNRDEALCAYDGNILDDEIRDILKRLTSGARLTVICDSCHSGTSTRSLLRNEQDSNAGAPAVNAPKPRYMPPEDENSALRTMMIPIRHRAFYPESNMNEVLITGCNSLEYSYDAYLGGQYNGAMTFNAINIIKNNPTLTYREFHRRLRFLLPTTQFPQSPQLEGNSTNKDRVIFS